MNIKNKKLKTSKIYKTILSAFIFFTLVIYTAGCSDSPLTNTNSKTYKARTERDFEDKNFKAEPGAVIVLNLEDKNSPPDTSWYDTDVIGIDIIPIRYTETAKHHFKIDEDSDFEISLISDSSKQVLFELTQQNKETDVMIPAGDYLMIITSLETYGSDTLGGQTVFIQPDAETTGSANTDYDPAQLHTLLSTRNCGGCNLSGANLRNANLLFANLSRANLSSANLIEADLIFANLSYADFYNANAYRANLSYSILNNAVLSQSSFPEANLSNAKLYGAHLYHTDFKKANFSNAILEGAGMTKADFRNANLNHANFTNALMHDVLMQDVNLSHANLKSAQLIRAQLNNAKLNNTNLIYADLSFARAPNANFSHSDLRSAIFCLADKTGIITTGVITWQTECWP